MMNSSNKTVVITGASDGIGAATARRLSRKGHRVVVVGRSPGKTLAVARELGAEHHVADFARLADVRELADELLSSCSRIDVLANNAGGIFGGPTKTADGHEEAFQVNYLAPFLLTTLLMDRLVASRATVLHTASVAARLHGKVAVDDLNHERDFTSTRAYGTAKLENILFTKELHRRYHSQGISAAAVNPGNVASNFGTRTDARLVKFVATHKVTRAMLATPDSGADQLIWLIDGQPGVDWESGTYYEKRRPAKRVNPQALDPNLARQLWDRSEELLGQSPATSTETR